MTLYELKQILETYLIESQPQIYAELKKDRELKVFLHRRAQAAKELFDLLYNDMITKGLEMSDYQKQVQFQTQAIQRAKKLAIQHLTEFPNPTTEDLPTSSSFDTPVIVSDTVDMDSPDTALVTANPSTGKVFVLDDAFSMVRVDGVWSVDSVSADELKDDFERVTDPKEWETLRQAAAAAFSSL